MAQIRLESTVRQHPKFIKAGPAACWLYVCAIGYCQEHLTDGYISPTTLRQLGVKSSSGQGKLTVMCARLVEVGLFEQVANGWVIHDYLKHNKSADEIRAIVKKRKLYGAEGGKASGVSRRTTELPKQVASNQPTTANQIASRELNQVASNLDAETNRFAEPDLDLVDDHDRTEHRTAAPPRHPRSTDPAPDGNYRVIAKVARELLKANGFTEEGDLREAVKQQCSQQGIDIGKAVEHDVVHRACASEWVKNRIMEGTR